MPTETIHFGNRQQTGDSSLAGAPGVAFNVVVDGAGAVRRRPGLAEWDGFPASAPVAERIDGIHAFQGDLYYVTEIRKFFQVSAGVASNFSLSGAPSFLAGTSRPSFAETQFRLVIAGGLSPSKIDSGATQAALLGGSPPNSSEVIALSSRVMTNDLTSAVTAGRISVSGTGNAGNETWNGRFVTAEARPDAVVALRENSNEAFAFGETTLQVFTPDASTVLAPQRAVNRGCAAAGSVIRAGEYFAWLDDEDQFVVSDGRTIDEPSTPVSATLETIETVDDCWGFRLNTDQFDVLAWKFPTDGRTFAYQREGGWAQWSGWDPAQGHVAFPITAHYYWPTERLHLAGLEDGRIVKFDSTANTDLGDTIKAEVTTGFINHGTDAWKFADALHLTFKRGQTPGSTEPLVFLSWRDDLGAFCAPRQIGLGNTGDYVVTKTLRSLGRYRRRQWKLEFTADVEFVIASVAVDYTVGGN